MEGRDLVADDVDLDAAPVEPLAERFVVAPEVRLTRGVVLLDCVSVDNLLAHFSSQSLAPSYPPPCGEGRSAKRSGVGVTSYGES